MKMRVIFVNRSALLVITLYLFPMRTVFLWILLIFTSIDGVQAQVYQYGGGLRLGNWYGLQGKYFTSTQSAWEVILAPVPQGLHLSLLYESHKQIDGVNGLYGFAGIGPHLALWRDGRYNPWWDDWDRDDWRDYYAPGRDPDLGRVALGVDMILGAEYRLPNWPVSLTLDWKPTVMVLGNPSMIWDDLALSIRFVR